MEGRGTVAWRCRTNVDRFQTPASQFASWRATSGISNRGRSVYAREVLSKPEMLSLVRDLLHDATEKAFDHGRGGGSREANDLTERFKDILTQRGVLPNPLERAWFTPKVTMEELLQASQCTPSFRMLPDEREVAPCSGRSQKDQSVLNDMWVSIPTGSEDSTFARQVCVYLRCLLIFRLVICFAHFPSSLFLLPIPSLSDAEECSRGGAVEGRGRAFRVRHGASLSFSLPPSLPISLCPSLSLSVSLSATSMFPRCRHRRRGNCVQHTGRRTAASSGACDYGGGRSESKRREVSLACGY